MNVLDDSTVVIESPFSKTNVSNLIDKNISNLFISNTMDNPYISIKLPHICEIHKMINP